MKISQELLSDTLKLVSLAREAELKQGRRHHASRLESVEERLRGIVTESHKASRPARSSEIMQNESFQTLLATVQSSALRQSPSQDPLVKMEVIRAMAASGMSEAEIARHLGASREEVRLAVKLQRRMPGKTGALR